MKIAGTHTRIRVRHNGEETLIREVPEGDFQLTGVVLQHNQRATDQDLAHLQDCEHLTLLHLGYTNIGDAGLAYFQGCTQLTELHLSGGAAPLTRALRIFSTATTS